MSKVMGVDQSYTNCGFVVKDETNDVIEFGTFKTAAAMDVYDRAQQLADFIVGKVKQHEITKLNIEGLAFGIRGDATRDLAGLLFTVITNVRRHTSATIEIIAPTSLKRFATGSGKSDKAAMISSVPEHVLNRFLEAKYKKTTGLADVCDAYWLASFK